MSRGSGQRQWELQVFQRSDEAIWPQGPLPTKSFGDGGNQVERCCLTLKFEEATKLKNCRPRAAVTPYTILPPSSNRRCIAWVNSILLRGSLFSSSVARIQADQSSEINTSSSMLTATPLSRKRRRFRGIELILIHNLGFQSPFCHSKSFQVIPALKNHCEIVDL